MISRVNKIKILFIALLLIVAGLCFTLPSAIAVNAEGSKTNRYYQTTVGSDKIYDLLGLREVTNVESDSAVYLSTDGKNYTAAAYPSTARYVKSTSSCSIYINELPTAAISNISGEISCYEGQGIDKLYDNNEKNYMSTIGKTFTLNIQLDDYYELTGFKWYSFEGNYPYGTVYYSLNGSVFTKWADFDFTDTYVEDRYVVDNYAGYLMTEFSSVKCKYIRVDVTGGKESNVAARELTFYGSAYIPDDVDPEGVTINGKNADGAYNTKETALSTGDTFTLSATYNNALSVRKTEWISENPNMLEVDEFGKVKVLRGGSADYYVIKASVTAPDGTVYTDSIKVYVKGIINLAALADISWYGVAHFYGAPAKAFDNINGTWGNWMQATDGTTEYSVTCDFKQSIHIGKVAIYIGVNAPESITVKGLNANGVATEINKFTPESNSELVIEEAGAYNALVFEIKEKSAPSTICEIEIFNHESFALSGIQDVELPSERGPQSQMEYIPQKNPVDAPITNEYDKKYSIEEQTGMFKYSHFNLVYIAAIVLGAGSIAVIAITVATFIKRRTKNDKI